MLHVATLGKTTALANFKTFEFVPLSGDDPSLWILHFTDDGDGFLARPGAEPVWVHTLLRHHLASVGEEQVVITTARGSEQPKHAARQALLEFLGQKRVCNIHVPTGALNSERAFRVGAFLRGACGSVLMWSLHSIFYTCTDSEGGGASFKSWLQSGFVAWAKDLAELLDSDSRALVRAAPQQSDTLSEHADRPFAFAAASTCGLIALLRRWTCETQRFGR